MRMPRILRLSTSNEERSFAGSGGGAAAGGARSINEVGPVFRHFISSNAVEGTSEAGFRNEFSLLD
jgi:hypothetical protein